MNENKIVCKNCNSQNLDGRSFCEKCGAVLNKSEFDNPEIIENESFKIKRIKDNIINTPHTSVLWSDIVDLYARKVEQYKAFYNIEDLENSSKFTTVEKMNRFLDLCYKGEFQIAFVGTIKTGKSTLMNALLGKDYASEAITPETAALTKFRSSVKDYIKVTFYTKEEWAKLWKSISSNKDVFMQEYKALNAETYKNQWIGHKEYKLELLPDEIEKELAKWTSCRYPEHYFVKEVEVGLSTLPSDFPKQLVFVDTPGLSDPVRYRSEITKNYIKKANAIFLCVDVQKLTSEEYEMIAGVLAFCENNKEKVHVIVTHWDMLHNPTEDWEKQKNNYIKQLSGLGYYGSSALAAKNIIHSSAYMYKLCKNYENLDDAEYGEYVTFATKLGLCQFSDMRRNPGIFEDVLPEVKRATNMSEIKRLISDRLVSNYASILGADIRKLYGELIHDIERSNTSNQKDLNSYIKTLDANIDEQRNKIIELAYNKEQIRSAYARLKDILYDINNDADNNIQRIWNSINTDMKK